GLPRLYPAARYIEGRKTNNEQPTNNDQRPTTNDGLLLRPPIDPVVDRLVPKLSVLRLQHPVAFVGEVEHFGRDAQALQRGKELEAFAHVEPVVELPVDDERRRFEIRRKQMRRPLPIQLAVRPRCALELPFVEPQLLGRSPVRLVVERAVVRDDALEAVGVAEHPVGHVSAKARAQSALAVFINKSVMLLSVV